MNKHELYNIKNGCFSNKFDFQTCIATKDTLAQQLWKINYASALYDTGGKTELVVRQYIPYNENKTPTIYNGMPLREEIRVFYNMDTKQIEYITDYWNYFYCYENIHNISDKIIFNWFHNQYGESSNNRQENHLDILDRVVSQIQDNIHTLKFDDKLKGIWSIDFMYVNDMVDKWNGIYLIDMARGFRSAYWDIDKLKQETREAILNDNSDSI